MLTEREKTWNWIRYGEAGDYAENEENGRKIVRKSTNYDTLPTCLCYINGEFAGTRWGHGVIAWLYGEGD